MGKAEQREHSGFILIDKPEGITSRKALDTVLNTLHAGGGYEGILDPFASGLILAGVGTACRFFRYFSPLLKQYTAVLKLGEETDTLDREGTPVEKRDVPDISEADIERIQDDFTGVIEQVPPSFSALKKDGRRGYELARSGSPVRFDARSVFVKQLEVTEYDKNGIRFSCSVSRGTYIRSLARDIARSLGTAGHLTALRRIGIGNFSVEDALPPADIRFAHIMPADSALYWFDELRLDDTQAGKIVSGAAVRTEAEPGLYKLRQGTRFLGIGEYRQGYLRPHRLLPANT